MTDEIGKQGSFFSTNDLSKVDFFESVIIDFVCS